MRKWRGQFNNVADQSPPLFFLILIGCGEFSQVRGAKTMMPTKPSADFAEYGTP